MGDFSNLNMDSLKKEIIGAYDISEDCNIRLLKYSENLTYLVEENRRKKYVLRIYRPGYHDKEEMLGELLWVSQLNQDTDLKMADVIPGIDGEFIQKLHNQYKQEGLASSLFEFLPGENLREVRGEELLHYMKEIGEITAKLHQHVLHWKKSSRIKRFTWNFEDLVGETSRWGNFREMKTLTLEQRNIYEKAAVIVQKRLLQYGTSGDRYGLIHSDLNINNILVYQNDIYILDFDDCGFGWFLYDLSTSVLEYFEDELEACIKALLKGYQKYRSLTREDFDELETFIVLRKIVRVGWIATHSDNDTVKKIEPDYYEKTAEMALKYIEKNRNYALGNA